MLTPEQTQDLVDHFGSNFAAARAVGVTHPTICYWLNPEWAARKRDAVRDHYDRLTGTEYNHRLLQKRRTKALARRRQRSARGGLDGQNR